MLISARSYGSVSPTAAFRTPGISRMAARLSLSSFRKAAGSW